MASIPHNVIDQRHDIYDRNFSIVIEVAELRFETIVAISSCNVANQHHYVNHRDLTVLVHVTDESCDAEVFPIIRIFV